MEIEHIRAIIDELTGVMDDKELEELEIEAEGIRVLLRRAAKKSDPHTVMVASHAGPMHPGHPAAAHGEAPPAEEEDEDLHIVHSPMVGSFYRAPAPDADPFVEVGDEVTPDTVVCIIEAMKVMNELKAEVEGTVVAVKAEGGEAVEYGQPLFVIRPTHD